jgi:3-keto-disaccharide hydrolase
MKITTVLILFLLLVTGCSSAPAEKLYSIPIPTYDPLATAFAPPTQIPSPQPLPTKALDQPWPLPHTDDFSDPASGWETGSWDTGSIDYTNGKYEVTSLGNSYFMWGEPYMKFGDISIEVDAAQVSGPDSGNTGYGFFCRRNQTEDSGTGYALLVSGDGNYSIQKSTGGDYAFLQEWTQSDAIKKAPAENHLKGECVGDKLRLYSNGTLLTEMTDADFPVGDIALTVVSFENVPVTVEFDNFKVSVP